MTSLPEQLSAASATQAQFDAQFRFFHTCATQALDNASRIVALNLSASRDSIERSSHTVRQLIDATEPRDLLVLRAHAEEQVRSLFNYGRELFNIGANAQPYGLRTIAHTAAPPVATTPVVTDALVSGTRPQAAAAALRATDALTQHGNEQVDEHVDEQRNEHIDEHVNEQRNEQVAQASAKVPAPAAPPEPFVVEQAEPVATAAEVQATILEEAVPVSTQKPIARAAGKGAPKAAAAPQPLAAPIEDKDSAAAPRVGAPSRRRK